MATFDAGSIDATLTLDRSPFAEGLRLARADADAFEQNPINIGLDLAGQEELARLREQIAALDGKNIRLDINTSGVAELDRLRLALAELDNKGITIHADIAPAMIEVDRLRESISTLDANVNIHMDTAGASAELLALRAEVDALTRGAGGGGGSGGGGNNGSWLDQLFGGDSAAPSMMLTAIATLAPIAAAAVVPLTAAVVGLASAMTSAGTGVGVLALGIVPVVKGFTTLEKQLEAAQTALSKTVPGTQQYATALAKVNAIQEQLNTQYGPLVVGLESLRVAWGQFKDATHEDAMGLIVQGMQVAQEILPRLLPIWDAFAPVVSNMLTHLRYFIAGPEMARFLAFIQIDGPIALTSLVSILGNVGGTFVNLMEAFAPFSLVMIHGLDEMTARWDHWAAHLGDTKGFKDFIDYATTQGPIMLQTLKEVAGALIAIGQGMAPLAGPNMTALRILAETISSLPPDVITALAIGFEAWAVGMWAYTAATTAAAIATVALDIAASPIILMFLASAGVVLAVVAAVVALGIGIYELATKTQFFQTVWGAVWGAVQATWSFLVDAFHVGVDAISATWDALSGATAATWNAITGAVSAAGSAITGAASAVIDWFHGIWDAYWGSLMGQTVKAAIDMIVAAVQLGMALVQFAFDWAMAGAKFAWGEIVNAVETAAHYIGIGASAIKDAVVYAWDYVRDRTVSAWNSIVSAVSGPLGVIKNYVSAGVDEVKGWISAGWTYVHDKTVSSWNSLISAVSTPLTAVKTTVSGWIDDIKGFFDGAETWLVHAGEAIIDGLLTGLGHKFNQVKDKFNEITGMIRDHLPGSPVKEGPLRVLNDGYAGGQIAGMLADGITSQAHLVRRAVNDLADLTGMQLGGTGYINARLGIAPVSPPSVPPTAANDQPSEQMLAMLVEMQAMREATEEMTAEFKRQNDQMVVLARQGIQVNR